MKCNIFKRSCAQADLQTGQMFKLLSKEIVPQSVQKRILSTEKVAWRLSQRYVEACLTKLKLADEDDIDLETVIGTHEFANTNRMLLQPDGPTYPTTDKNTAAP